MYRVYGHEKKKGKIIMSWQREQCNSLINTCESILESELHSAMYVLWKVAGMEKFHIL